MPLTNAGQVRSEGNLAADTPETKLAPHIHHAETKLREVIGSTLYDTVAGETTSGAQDRRGRLERAEACFALAFAIPVLNIRANPTEGGLVSSIGFAETKNSLLTQDEIDKLVERFENRAMALVSEYIEIDETSTSIGNGLSFISV